MSSGARLNATTTFARALAAAPGSHLSLGLGVDSQRLRGYLSDLDRRFGHGARDASVRLVGTRAIVEPLSAPVQVDLRRMTADVTSALESGLSERLRLIVEKAPAPGQPR